MRCKCEEANGKGLTGDLYTCIPCGMLCILPAWLQALREAIAALYENLKPEQLVVRVPEEGAQ
jgi:hypothetical protein